jgi:hypothetical protein
MSKTRLSRDGKTVTIIPTVEIDSLEFGTSPRPHRDLPRRMLAAVETRVRELNQRSTQNAKSRARLQEANEILGTLRAVVKAYESTDTPV